MKDLNHVKKVEKMIKDIKSMDLSLPEKMFYVYHLFLEDITDEMKEELRKDVRLHSELTSLKGKKDKVSKAQAEALKKVLLDRDRRKAKSLPALADRIKAEVADYAANFENKKWAEEEKKRRKSEEETIAKIRQHIQKA